MASGGYGPVFRQVERLFRGDGTATALGEDQLLRRFAADRDEAAFEALVTRHGPMVLGTCRRMLANSHDVDDAFQATFLVLARKAGSIRDGDRLGPWLHGVARRVATRSRVQSARRNARERSGADDQAAVTGDLAEAHEVRSVLDEELARLPEKFRAPLVLCYLEGMTHDEAATQLSCPVGTVRSRLAEGRNRLRSRLTRRGLAPSETDPALLPILAIPEGLLSSTIRVATQAGTVPTSVAILAKGAMAAMIRNKLKAWAVVGLTASLTVGGAGALAQYGGIGGGQAPPAAKADDTKVLETISKKAGDFEKKITALESSLALIRQERDNLRREIDALKQKLGEAPGSAPAKVAADPNIPPAPSAPQPVAPPRLMGGPGGSGGPAQPTMLTLDGDPTYFLLIPAVPDRVTILNSETQERQAYPLPGGLTKVSPVINRNLMGFSMEGSEVKRLEVYDRYEKKWQHQDLREPTKSVSAMVGPLTVSYQVGRSLYIYSGPAKKWAVLETTSAGANSLGFGGLNYSRDPNKIIYRDGTTLHIYDVQVGEWKQIDIRDDK